MADNESKSQHRKMKTKTKTKKRKQHSTDKEEICNRPSKSHRTDQQTIDSSPWRNLQLILSLQSNSTPLREKLELANNYVKSRKEGAGESREEIQTVSISRVIVFLNNWVQRILVSSEKKIRMEGDKHGMEIAGSYLDYRCWVVFRFCLEESKKLGVPLHFLRDLLRVIQYISRDALTRLGDEPMVSEELELHGIVLDCISLVYSSHGGISNENLDLWILLISVVLEFVQKVLNDKLDGTKAGIFAKQLFCYLLEPFVKFLKVHPTRKNGFREFIDKLFEDLVILWDALDVNGCESGPEWKRNVSVLIEEVLSQALFHPTHIGGFLSLQSTSKYRSSDDKKSEEEKTFIKSYHRHLFDKLGKIITGKNASALSGAGELLRLFINCIYMKNGVLVGAEAFRHQDGNSAAFSKSSSNSSEISKSPYYGLDAEARKSVFDFFVEIMELFLSEINTHSQVKLEAVSLYLDVSTLRSINKLLATCVQEKVYIRTEDTSEGACFNFLKLIYDAIMSLTAQVNQLLQSFGASEERIPGQLLIQAAKEIFLAIHYLVDIEYEVVGDDLEKVWAIILALTASSHSLMNASDQHLLTSEVLKLGCRLVHLHSELRQVNIAIFTLSKAVREVVSAFRSNEAFRSSFLFHSFANSLSMLLCSPEFRLSIRNAVKSIPEGQASGCIRQLIVDVAESLEWIKSDYQLPAESEFAESCFSNCGTLCFDLKAELLGKSLTELYTLILDSMTITTGNSNSIALSVKDLMAVIRPGLSTLVSQDPDVLNVFFPLVTGRAFSRAAALGNAFLSVYWIVVFFFRLYMSCKSLQRQAISLMPPDASKKMSRALADSFAAYSAKDWLERTVWEDESYFSWVVLPSAPLPAVIHTIAEFCHQHTVIDCCLLIYVLNGMALQRLVDLNRQMKSIDYLLQRNDNLVQARLDNDAGLLSYSKDTKKWKKHVSTLRKEAAGLTEFLMRYLSLVTEDRISKSSVDQVSSKDIYLNHLYETEVWDLGTGSIDEKLFPSALWWIICQNVDIWCPHACKKDLKKFLLALLQNSLPCLNTNVSELRNHIEKSGYVTGVNRHLVSVELLSNTILYEQRPICRHMASRFCQILKKSVSSIFSYVGEVDLDSSPDWENAIHVLQKSSTTFSRLNHPQDNDTLLNDIPDEPCEKELSPTFNTEITRCRTFLNLLSWIPKGHLSSKSSSLYATSILNIDRLVVSCLFDQHGSVALCDRYELLRLLVTCRRTFKNLLMASCERKTGHQSLLACLLSENSPVFWLLKSLSAITGFQSAFSQETSPQLKHMIFSLMDHTSFILLTLFKDQFKSILALTAGKSYGGELSSADGDEETVLKENGPCSDFSDNGDAWRSVSSVAGTLTGHAQNLLDSLNVAAVNRKVGDLARLQEMDKVSPVVSCFQGFLCGLASAMDSLDIKSSSTLIESTSCNLKIKPCTETCADLLNSVLHLLFLEGNQCPQGLSSIDTSIETECCNELLATGTHQSRDSANEVDNVNKEEHHSGSAGSSNDSQKFGGIESLLANVDFGQQYLRKSLLQGLYKGENLEAAFCLKQIFGASSAILKFSLHTKSTSLPPNLLSILIRVSQVLLSEFADHSGSLEQFSFIWLDGVAKFIGELGNIFPLLNPLSSRDLFVKQIELHLRAMGKCISLQGKDVTLASREIESSTKMLSGLPEHDLSNSHWLNHLDELKSRLRMSFVNYVSRASELHLLSAIQAIERALVGVQEHCIINYEVTTGSSHGARVSANVAAGIDCLDLILESVSGHRKLSVVKRHIQNLVSSLLNVVLHLQGPKIFFRNLKFRKDFTEPDPGAVCLMCISVLTKISAKHAFFQLEAFHIGQLLHMPAAIFQCVFQLWTSKVPLCSNYTGGLISGETEVPGSERSAVDRQFCIKLYAACCRMLCTVLKHHRSETRRCNALLEDSVGRLLNCLEMVCTSPVGGDCFGWEVQGGVKCASFLRRVYEEIRQHKDVYGDNCFQFLSCYIWVYCGYGRLRNGIIREIDEALRPGVYALIDACSADDLQRLHTVFGEGPCRNTLASLQHDYKIHFQYGGKVKLYTRPSSKAETHFCTKEILLSSSLGSSCVLVKLRILCWNGAFWTVWLGQ
ncbi:hypothetical protein K7X08_007019 [Anisodus acutangulus]|uniref:Nucleolar 27S pre-rRNA processing Urb2/Npa2 C-terminal domain-containing protein n=1 Tax=Anisodus acutangulus TaxID=402998 RepID=A0A9Q1LFA0_9SOLA|nr:hypothetical protein K7X08_007019 [Anisodus acutangulus]